MSDKRMIVVEACAGCKWHNSGGCGKPGGPLEVESILSVDPCCPLPRATQPATKTSNITEVAEILVHDLWGELDADLSGEAALEQEKERQDKVRCAEAILKAFYTEPATQTAEEAREEMNSVVCRISSLLDDARSERYPYLKGTIGFHGKIEDVIKDYRKADTAIKAAEAKQ